MMFVMQQVQNFLRLNLLASSFSGTRFFAEDNVEGHPIDMKGVPFLSEILLRCSSTCNVFGQC